MENDKDKEKELRALLANMTLFDLKAHCDRHSLKIKNRDKLGAKELIERIVAAERTKQEAGF